jgi:hypothetical protein
MNLALHQEINAFYEAGVKRIHFWPTLDFNKQLENFSSSGQRIKRTFVEKVSSQESNTEEKYELVFLLHYQIYSNHYSQYTYLKAQEPRFTRSVRSVYE